ncbi:MAG: LuxR C-terminal-related transcriptional regulator [Actinomycetota bacterium]|nr:LuxR C-terminal-related transcriptional regulator [Actinomycetota bacterium]
MLVVVDRLRLADLLGGLSMVADLGFGLPPQMAMRTCLVATALARTMNLSDDDVRDSFYTALLMHIGCISVAHETTMAFGDDIVFNRAISRTNGSDPADIASTLMPAITRGMAPETRARVTEFALLHGPAWGRKMDTGVCEVGRYTARRIGLPESTQRALHEVYEWWNGGWAPQGLGGEEIAIAARVARAAADAAYFDHLAGADAAVAALRDRAGTILDPAIVDLFANNPDTFLREANEGDPRDLILDAEPTPVVVRTGTGLREVAAAFGDVTDLKLPFLHGHAQDVARLTTGAARRLRLSSEETEHLEIAALLHDVGRAGVSNAIWEKAAPLTRADWEQVRMHGYLSERILATSPSLEPMATTAGMHHERLDGSGYHRCSTVTAMPMPARILAVADAFAAMTQTRPHRPAKAPEEAARALTHEAKAGRLDPDAVEAVLAEAGHPVGQRLAANPGGLSDRELEVLRLLAEGNTNAEIAGRLFISRRTAEHHVQHIYVKVGVSTRAGAALFAMEHGLVGTSR